MTLDLYGCKEGVCDDLDLCYNFLEDLVVQLKMKKQSPPYIFRSDAVLYPEKAGLSGWVPLIESSIVIHTLSPKRYISVDIYSCKQFDPVAIEKWVTEYFGSRLVDSQFLKRGLSYHSIDMNGNCERKL